MLTDSSGYLQRNHYSMTVHCQQMVSYYNSILSTTILENWKQIYEDELSCYKIYDV